MAKGRLILIEGTDCSGKQTQTELLIQRLRVDGYQVELFSFPMYDTPTGKIIGGPYLGKEHISEGYFPEGAVNVDPKVASLFYAADRKYNIKHITDLLDAGVDVILDRYIFSNFAHQGGKIKDPTERLAMYKWLEELEFGLMELPKPDKTFLLYMPYAYALKLKADRLEKPDQHEADKQHLIAAEKTYLELAHLYNFDIINCVENDTVRPREEIHQEVYQRIRRIKR